MNNLEEYGNKKINNFKLITSKRLKKEMAVLYRLLDGYTDFLDSFNRLKTENINDFIEKIIEFEIIEQNHIFLNVIFQNKYVINISMIFPKEYPFKPPQVKICEIEYKLYLSRIQMSIRNNRNYDTKCLCCNTICCRNIWNPHKNLFDVIIEIFINLNILYAPINKIMYKAILNKYLGYQID